MNQPNTLELAKQGDEEAITSVINYLLQDKGITATAAWKETSLLILLKSAQLPDQQSSVALVRKVMMKLGIASLKAVEVYGKQIGQDSAAWKETLNLTAEVEEPNKLTSRLKSLSQVNLPAITTRWPVWFPYPGSWFRALLLVLIAFPGAILIVFGFGGILLSIIINNPLLSIFFTLVGLLPPAIFLSLIYNLIWFRWKNPALLTRWFKFWQGSNSLWEGLYATIVMGLSFLAILFIFAGMALLACHFGYQISESIGSCTGRRLGSVARAIFDSIENIWELNGRGVLIKQNDVFSVKIWFVIWLIIAAYLYQGEYLIRKRFTAEKLAKTLLLSILALWLAQAIYLVSSTLAEMPKAPIPIASEVPSPVPSIPATPPPSVTPSSPVPIEAASPSPQPDSFRNAVNTAMSAAKMTQLAKSQAEWNTVADQWQEAITLMKAVPKSSPNYAVAQQKVIQYQPNVAYARSAASRAK